MRKKSNETARHLATSWALRSKDLLVPGNSVLPYRGTVGEGIQDCWSSGKVAGALNC